MKNIKYYQHILLIFLVLILTFLLAAAFLRKTFKI